MSDRKPDAAYTEKYKQARETKTVRFDLYLDDPAEKELFDNLEKLKNKKQLKYSIVSALQNYLQQTNN